MHNNMHLILFKRWYTEWDFAEGGKSASDKGIPGKGIAYMASMELGGFDESLCW